MTEISVADRAQRSALFALGRAVENYKRACEKVQTESARNLQALQEVRHHPGFSHQTLVECARHEASYEAALERCRDLELSEEIEVVILDPGSVYSIRVEP